MTNTMDFLLQRIASLDAPILLAMAPGSDRNLHEDLPEELLERALSIMEDVQDAVVGIFVSVRDFLPYGSGGIAALEAIYEAARELELLVISDIGVIRFAADIPRVTVAFYREEGVFHSDGMSILCPDPAVQELVLEACPNAVIFFHEPTSHSMMYCAKPQQAVRNNNLDAFLLIDENGEPSSHFRRSDSRGVLHILRPASIWGEKYKEGDTRSLVFDFAKKILSLGE